MLSRLEPIGLLLNLLGGGGYGKAISAEALLCDEFWVSLDSVPAVAGSAISKMVIG